MTTYDDLYPGAAVWTQARDNDNDDGVVKCKNVKPCWNCGVPTAWVDLDFAAHLCSPMCRDVKWSEYFRALRDTDHDELTII